MSTIPHIRHSEMARATRFVMRAATSLTKFEVYGRNHLQFPLGDGHAAQTDVSWWQEAIKLLPEFEAQAAALTDEEAERRFIGTWMPLFGQTWSDHPYKILPNASMSISVLMRLARRRDWNVQLIEPVFDNLYKYCREYGVPLTALPERLLQEHGADALDIKNHHLICLVSPNNPTGFTLDSETFRTIAERCAYHGVTLAIDASFRAYDLSGTDHYAILVESGCSWVVIEDTGKTFPTSERKASLISCSRNLKNDMFEIVEVDVLGWSSPVLVLLTHLAKTVGEHGLDHAIRSRVRWARDTLRTSLGGTFLRPARSAVASGLPVDFLEILDNRYDDLDVVARLERRQVGVLPGRHFYFSPDANGSRYIRVSLLKQKQLFQSAVRILHESILSDFTDRA